MSGISSKLNNDQCYVDQYVTQGTNASNYAHFLPSRVNPTSDPKLPQCTKFGDDVTACSACASNNEATITYDPSDFHKRTDIESCLRGIGKPLSLCGSASNYACVGEVAFNPLLCDRDITPTNLPKFQ